MTASPIGCERLKIGHFFWLNLVGALTAAFVERWEGLSNSAAYAHKNFFGDVHLDFAGGVTCELNLQSLLESFKKGGAEDRNAAADTLRKAYSNIARMLGLFRPGSAGRGLNPDRAPLR